MQSRVFIVECANIAVLHAVTPEWKLLPSFASDLLLRENGAGKSVCVRARLCDFNAVIGVFCRDHHGQ